MISQTKTPIIANKTIPVEIKKIFNPFILITPFIHETLLHTQILTKKGLFLKRKRPEILL